MEIDFDSWEDYKPLGDTDLSELVKIQPTNPNLLKLKSEDDINLLGLDKTYYQELFDYYSEEDYDGSYFIRFIKSEEFKNKGESIILFDSPKNEDIFLLKKSEKLYFLNIYQSNNYYQDDDKLTFTGWDYNIIVNLNDMSAKTKYTR